MFGRVFGQPYLIYAVWLLLLVLVVEHRHRIGGRRLHILDRRKDLCAVQINRVGGG